MKWMVIENIATMAVTAALVAVLWWMGAGGYSFVSLVLLLNMNYVKKRSEITTSPPKEPADG